MTYQLWDTQSRNLIDEFEEEAAAWDAVRAYLTPDASGTVIDVGLVVFDEAGEPVRSIHGGELTALAVGAAADEARRSA
jgi:hypothetical protein